MGFCSDHIANRNLIGKPLSITASTIAAGLFFAMLLSTFGSELKSPEPEMNETELTLIDFSNASAAGWQIVNDSVMGGISRSTLQLHEDGYALFSGTVSLENNGGFASVRTRAQAPMDLSDFEGLSVQVSAGIAKALRHWYSGGGGGEGEEPVVALKNRLSMLPAVSRG